jgi:UDP-glucose 4-epimerase
MGAWGGNLGRVVLVTGVARPLAGRFVRRVQRESDVDRVIGVDTAEPVHRLGGAAEFVPADIRQPDITGVLARYGVDTVVHMDVNASPSAVPGSGGRGSVKEVNVIGTMQLLGACQKAPAVRRLVVKSTTSVYGGTSRDPAVFDESTAAKSLPGGGFAKDAVEVEGYVRGFARRRPDVSVTVLRFAHVLGASMDSPLAAYFGLPVLPTVLGYDPRLQFVHEDDAVEVLRLAAHEPRRGTLSAGTFNIAGDGTLLLSQCARRLGRPTVPMPLPAIRWGRSLLQSVGVADFPPEQVRLLTHGRVVRTTQMREVLGFEPRFTTGGALAAFARGRGPGLLPPETLAHAVDRVASVVAPPGEAAGRGPQDEEAGRHG